MASRRPLRMELSLAWYLLKMKLKGRKRFPLTMILEPLEDCNLACLGCGRIREYEHVFGINMTVEDALKAVDECDAPVVSIAGGEPMMHPQIGEIVAGIIKRKKYVYLCTNALLFKKAFKVIPPSPYFSFVVHLDGLREVHDVAVDRKGVYDVAIRMIKEAKERGYRVCTNTTLYSGNQPEDYHEFFKMLGDLGVEGMMISPGFEYKEVSHLPLFMQRQEANSFFSKIFQGLPKGLPFYNNPLYLDFLQGKREYQCSQWTTPTYTVVGWRKPCYLIADEHARTFAELMETTEWDRYGLGKDPRCATCMMHCGFEGSAITEAMSKPKVLAELVWRSVTNNAYQGNGTSVSPKAKQTVREETKVGR